jgi:hypothetical protein
METIALALKPCGARGRRTNLKLILILLIVVSSLLTGCSIQSNGAFDKQVLRVQQSNLTPQTQQVQAQDGYFTLVINITSKLKASDIDDVELHHAESNIWYGVMTKDWVLEMDESKGVGVLKIRLRVDNGEHTFDSLKLHLSGSNGFVPLDIPDVKVSSK